MNVLTVTLAKVTKLTKQKKLGLVEEGVPLVVWSGYLLRESLRKGTKNVIEKAPGTALRSD